MPRQTEPIVNSALGGILAEMLPRFEVRSENTRAVVDRPGLRLDVSITGAGRSPVVVEAEFMPAYSAEDEAKSRLGLEVVGAARRIDAAIALRYPDSVADATDLRDALLSARASSDSGEPLSYCVRYADGSRFPESGWLEGSVEDLADLITLVSVPQRAVDAAADALQRGIDRAAAILTSLSESRPDVTDSVAALLGMSEVIQTRRMAGAIVANAMVFHERLAGMHGVKPLSQLCSGDVASPKSNVLDAWAEILDVNYWPIFAIARDIVDQLPAAEAAQMLVNLRSTVEDVAATGANQAHDLTGRIFQRLIADRKYLATFYTLPASAALLARLAVSKLDVDWSDADAIAALRVGDFACGTGALLSAVYERMAARHERAGGDVETLHPTMMEEVLYGCDVMPSAIHITGSTLSGAYPTVGFGKTRLYTLAYGRQEDGDVRIGSLELLQSSSSMTLFNTSDPALRTGSAGEETAAQVVVDVADAGFDLVIMNPPFTRNVTREGATAGAVAAAFAAFDATDADQRDMTKRMARLKRDTCYHGNAGMASAFAALGDRKLKPGGVLALVLPLSAASGFAWRGFRDMLKLGYSSLTVLSIAANGKDMSFSSDTGMAECLVIARKNATATDSVQTSRTRFVSLRRRPQGFAEAREMAKGVVNSDSVRGVEDGPYGGTPIMVGDRAEGEALSAPPIDESGAWGGLRIADYSVAQTAYQLARSKLWLPGNPSSLEVRTELLGDVGKLGTYHLDIVGRPPRGPFDKASPSPTATYPSLWNHNAKNETRVVCEPDSQLLVRQGMESKAATVWATASRAHLNLDFRFNSQPLQSAFTERPSIGGRAWPNAIFNDTRYDYAFAIWSNSTLGLLMHWWHSNLQQPGRGIITIRSAESLPILDLRALTDAQLATSEEIFDDFRERELMPAYLADADPNRALLDRRVVRDLLGFDESIYRAVRLLAAKWSAEPSVHGGKRRPASASPVS